MIKNLNEGEFETMFQKNRDEDRSSPDPNIWNRLEDKLEIYQNKKTNHMYRNWALVASFLVLITTGIMFSNFFEKNYSGFFADNNTEYPINMEELGTSGVYLSELSNIDKLYNAYQNLEVKKTSLIQAINY